jgi:ribose 5-phosphate isomerase A
MNDSNVGKRAAAFAAADLIADGTTVGFGTGSTFAFVLERVAERMRQQRLVVRGVATSEQTAQLAQKLGIPVVALDDVEQLDLAIDGADEVDPQRNLIKGGGGAHLRERLVAVQAKELVVIVDDSKLVDVLGKAFRLPVEVVPFGWRQTKRRLAATGCSVELRRKNEKPFATDNGNLVLDCRYPGILDPKDLAARLDVMPGVVDHGLFVGMAGRVLVGDANGRVRTLGTAPAGPTAVRASGNEIWLRDLATFELALQQHPRILLFKHSPICPISAAARLAYSMWRLELPDVTTLFVNVVGEREVSRAIAKHCGVQHESPQAILFEQGKAVWNASHDAITVGSLHAAWAPRC